MKPADARVLALRIKRSRELLIIREIARFNDDLALYRQCEARIDDLWEHNLPPIIRLQYQQRIFRPAERMV